MGTFNELIFSENNKNEEFLHISPKKIKASLTIHKFVDNETKQFICFLPALDITSYGETEEKAQDMLKSCIDDVFEHLTSLSPKALKIELSKMGWKQRIFKKEFSKAYVDINGDLKNFNTSHSKVERLLLTA